MDAFVPMLRAQQPAGWFVRESVQLIAPDGGANVIITNEPLDPSLSVKDYVPRLCSGVLLVNATVSG